MKMIKILKGKTASGFRMILVPGFSFEVGRLVRLFPIPCPVHLCQYFRSLFYYYNFFTYLLKRIRVNVSLASVPETLETVFLSDPPRWIPPDPPR